MTSASSLEAEQRRHRAEGLLARAQHRRRSPPTAPSAGRSGAGERVPLAAGSDLRALGHRVGDVALDLLHRRVVDQRPLRHARLEAVADLERADRRRQPGHERVVDAVLHVEAVGAHAGLAGVAELGGDRALHGASRSASSNTMNGALPPSSSDSFLIVGAHCAIRMRPTSVEPVNVSLRTTSLSHSVLPMAMDCSPSPVTTFNTPAGMPARCASSASGQRGQRRLLGGLDHHGAAGRQRRRRPCG